MIDNENQDQFDQPAEFEETGEAGGSGQLKSNVAEAWRTRPIFKLLVLMIAVGALIAALIGFLSPKPSLSPSKTSNVPSMSEAPGGKATPAFIEAQQKANQQRIEEEARAGGSAIPTPLPSGISLETHKNEADPLIQFRAEMEKQKEEQRKQIQALQQQNTQTAQVTAQQDQQVLDKMAQGMQAQMGQLSDLWKPKGMSVVKGAVDEREGSGKSGSNASSTAPTSKEAAAKVPPVIAAGTVNYAQLLTTASSDAQAPILAQILSGPLTGARALGAFKVENDFLVMKFGLATLKGKEYKIDAFAIDPDTTLPALATEVDHRYFTRVVLPAAAAFVSELGSALGKKPTDTVVTNGVVITTQAETGIKDGLYAGMGAAGKTISRFFENEAQNTKVLVEVAAGTPIGLMFTKSVCAGVYPCTVGASRIESDEEKGGDSGFMLSGADGRGQTGAARAPDNTANTVQAGYIPPPAPGITYPGYPGYPGVGSGYGNSQGYPYNPGAR